MFRTNPDFSAYMAQLPGHRLLSRCWSPGEAIVRQGAGIQQVYVIREGITKCYMREDNGKDYIFEFLGPGEITGELEAIRNAPCICTIEAITPVTAWTMPHSDFNALLASDASLNRLVMGELATRLVQTCVRTSYQQVYPLEYGLLRFLMLQEAQQVFFSKQDMAAYLGITVRSFNRTLQQLRAKKVIAVDGLQLDLTRNELDALLRRFGD